MDTVDKILGTRRIPQGQKGKPVTRRTGRRQPWDKRSSWAVWAVAAAVLAAVMLIVVLSTSEKDPAASQKAKEARARASEEAGARRQAERARLERERALAESKARRQEAEAQAKRRAAELQLREIEEKRRALTQVKPAAVEGPEAKAQRERDLEALKRDQEQIEQELREAAQLAKKTAPSTPAKPPQSENPQSPLAAPAPQPQGGTQAELAKVEEISGEAFLVAKDGKTPVTAGANLLFGQGLQTGGGASRIVLRFSDKTRVDLGPETSLSEIKIDSGKHLAVTQGTIRAVVAKQPKGEPLILIIPHGEAKVVGTTLRLYVDPDPKKGTRLEVEEGKVELKNLAGKTVMVESGHYAVAAVGVELVVHRSPYLSPNGSILYPGQGGSLVTAEGTWTFGGVSTDLGNYYTDLNGVAVGWAAEMEIMGGSLYCHNTVGGDWFRWQNGTWIDIGPTAPSAAPKK